MTSPAALAANTLPFVSVVLPVLNGEGRLEHALKALLEQDYPRDRFEIIIADGRSRDGTVRIAKEFGCVVVDNPGITVAAGRNAGLQHARGELIAFSEDDIVVPPHWLTSAVRLLQDSGAAGVGGPTPIPRDSKLWSHAVNAVFRAASARGASVQSDRVLTGSVEDLPGGNSIYTAQALREAGPIDESLATAEDVAMHHELRRRGRQLLLSPELAVEHHKRDTVFGFLRQMQRFAIGRVQLFRRWRGALSPLHWVVAVAGPLALVALAACARDAALLALIAAGAWLTGTLLALRQGERPKVAMLFPLSLAVFVLGWSGGFWSEWLLPCRSATNTGFAQKLRDALNEVGFPDTRGLRWWVAGCLALQCILLGVFSQHAPLIMDEFQQGGYARHIDAGYYSQIFPFKTVLFTYLYYLPRLWLERASSILLFQRAQTVLLVLATLQVLYSISRRLGQTRVEALLVTSTTLAFSTFFEHGASLRAEPSALLLATLALYAAVSRGPRPHLADLACGVALGGAFFCTQKAVWFCVSIGLGLMARRWLDRRLHAAPGSASVSRRGLLVSALCLAGGFALVAIAYCFAFPPASPAQVFRGVFLRASRFAIETDLVYGDLRSFIWQSFRQNCWLYVLGAAGFGFAGARISRDAQLCCCWVATLGMGAFTLSWKEPWPYVLTWWIPFIALFVPDAFRVAQRSILRPRSPAGRTVAAALALLLPIGLSLPRRVDALSWDNRDQLALVDHVESLLAPGDSYQDGIGMISTRNLSGLVWWDLRTIARISAAAQRGDTEELAQSFRDDPKVLVMNYRLQSLARELEPFSSHSYVGVDRGLMVAGAALRDGQSRPFRAPWPGRYALVDGAGVRADRPWFLDGAEIHGGAAITRGPHELHAPSCRACYLIPEDIIGKVTPTDAPTRAELFAQPYTR